MERRLSERRRAADLPFDLKPATGSTLADLDLGGFEREYLPNAVAPDILEENQRSIEQQLVSLRFATPTRGAAAVCPQCRDAPHL